MRIMLLASAFNGVTQRLWDDLRGRGHHVAVKLFSDSDDVIAAAHAARPDLVLCPYLKQRVPAEVWRSWPTVILHPGPVGDQGPSSLDFAILDSEPVWGVTAFQAVEELDGGPIWTYRTFPMPADPPRKSALYGGPSLTPPWRVRWKLSTSRPIQASVQLRFARPITPFRAPGSDHS
jgi:putative two-component system protein, hydrogenase maturation factor HypX/HoxX